MSKRTPVPKTVDRRGGNRRWKHIYGVDRKYTERVDRAGERAIAAARDGTLSPAHIVNMALAAAGEETE